MKKFIPKLLLLAVVAMIAAACSKKDSGSPGTGGGIVGKWSVVSDTTLEYDNNNNLVSTYINTEIQPTDYVQFNSNGSGTEEEYGIQVDFTYKFSTSSNIIHMVYKSSNLPGGVVVDPIADINVKHLDEHTMYTEQITPDTVAPNVIYYNKDYIHFKK